MNQLAIKKSPKWGFTTKLVVSLSAVLLIGLLVINFRGILSTLLASFVLAYLFSPPAKLLNKWLKIPWKLAVTLLYLLLIILLLTGLTLGGITIFEQANSLIKFLQSNIDQVPVLLDQISHWKYEIGPFKINLAMLDFSALGNELLKNVQPAISQLGVTIGQLAGGTITTIGNLSFIFLISYFIMAGSTDAEKRFIKLQIPGYEDDISVLGMRLQRIWNAFIRGQFLVIVIYYFVYIIVFPILGLRYFYILALLAGLARFFPYIGPWVSWITYFLVAIFQGWNHFGMEPFIYAVLVMGVILIIDNILDSLVIPSMFSGTLEVHPAAVLVATLVAANLMGIVGVMLAAPVLATLKIFGDYVVDKLFDRDPWEDVNLDPNAKPNLPKIVTKIVERVSIMNAKLKAKAKKDTLAQNDQSDPKD